MGRQTALSRSENPRRALIIDRRAVMGTEICRSLARKGVAVDVIAAASSPAFRSRFCASRFPASLAENSDAFLTTVCSVVRNNRYDAIFVCNEEVLENIMAFPDYARWPGLVLPARSSLEVALSKVAMMQVAQQAGVAIPRTVLAESIGALPAIAAELGFPLIIKGDKGESGNHVRFAENLDKLIGAYRDISALERGATKLIAQEYLAGAAYSVGGLFHRGHPLRVYAHRKLVAIPPLGAELTAGMTVRGVTERCPGLLDEAFKIFRALEYSGLGHLELVRDQRSNTFKFLEINPRPWGTIGAAEYAGVDLFTPYLQLAAGADPEADLRFREGVRFHRLAREGKMIRRHPGRILGFIRDCLDPRVRSDFEWLDPGPHLAAFVNRGLGMSGFRARWRQPPPRISNVSQGSDVE
jgi:biotin carboxylase